MAESLSVNVHFYTESQLLTHPRENKNWQERNTSYYDLFYFSVVTVSCRSTYRPHISFRSVQIQVYNFV